MARYNFEPEGMDKNGGTIDVDSASVSIEFPSIAKVFTTNRPYAPQISSLLLPWRKFLAFRLLDKAF